MSLYLYSPLNNEKTARESPRFFKLRHKKLLSLTSSPAKVHIYTQLLRLAARLFTNY